MKSNRSKLVISLVVLTIIASALIAIEFTSSDRENSTALSHEEPITRTIIDSPSPGIGYAKTDDPIEDPISAPELVEEEFEYSENEKDDFFELIASDLEALKKWEIQATDPIIDSGNTLSFFVPNPPDHFRVELLKAFIETFPDLENLPIGQQKKFLERMMNREYFTLGSQAIIISHDATDTNGSIIQWYAVNSREDISTTSSGIMITAECTKFLTKDDAIEMRFSAFLGDPPP